MDCNYVIYETNYNDRYFKKNFRDDVEKHISQYTDKHWDTSIYNIFTTFFLLYTLFVLNNIIFFPIVGLLFLRLFIIFHDMCHNSYFPNNNANKFFSYIIGVMTFTPRSMWMTEHAHHHRYSNNLDKHQYSQSAPWTVNKYNTSSRLKKLTYRFIYNTYSLFSFLPIIYFIFIQRYLSKSYENVFQIIYVVFLWYISDANQLLLLCCAYIFGAAFGFTLLHLQHTFVTSIRRDNSKWSKFDNAFNGSSFLQIPIYLKYFTFGIEYHHIHHINPRVPCYNLEKCHVDANDLFNICKKIYPTDILTHLKLSLYDTNNNKFCYY
jgi:acyl-lipid omega-6 desaturase (Delta-12 desaturase)